MQPLPQPMKAVSGPLPDDDDGWAYEVKWDGMRVIAGIDGDRGLRAVSANGLDVTARFPELEGLVEHLGGQTAILDGEMVVFDGERSDFASLQQRIHVRDSVEARRRMSSSPAVFMVFDLLSLNELSTTQLTYSDRRQLLFGLIETDRHWQAPRHHIGDGAALFDEARKASLEGIMAKRLASRYEPGRRSPSWRKVKVRRRQELVVGGFTHGEGNRSGGLGALLVGFHDQPNDELHFAGGVGSGFDGAEADRLMGQLRSLVLEQSPFRGRLPASTRGATWVRPELVVEVAFAEWTSSGRLRHPTYLGRRIDRAAATVIREPDG